MRLMKRSNGVWYVEHDGKRSSLKTRDDIQARRTFGVFQRETLRIQREEIDRELRYDPKLEAEKEVHKEKISIRSQIKDYFFKIGRKECEVCGWRPPPAIPNGLYLLELHHVIPAANGGREDKGNFVILCPNHHAVADRMGRAKNYALGHGEIIRGVYRGPRTRQALIEAIKEMEPPGTP